MTKQFLFYPRKTSAVCSWMGCDASPCLKGPEMKDLKRHYSCPLTPLCSLFCACLHELYGCFHQRARMLFECVFFFFWLFGLKRVCRQVLLQMPCVLQRCSLFLLMPLSQNIPPLPRTIALSVCLMVVASGAYRRAHSETLFLRVMPACWDF